MVNDVVLNLIITGIPSILFKNAEERFRKFVLNLIITGIPSIRTTVEDEEEIIKVLNLIITGIPSILEDMDAVTVGTPCFKPYYNWNTFNTLDFSRVLNSWLFSLFFNPRNI